MADINDNVGPKIWKKYEDGYIVRRMTEADTKIVKEWYCGMGITPENDLVHALRSFPEGSPGFYIGEIGGEVVASAVRINWGEGIHYGSMYYTAEHCRKKGYGTRLRDEVARNHVGDGLLAIDSVSGERAMINAAKFGYVKRFLAIRYETTAKDDYGIVCDDCALFKATEADFDRLIEYDNKNFIVRDSPVRRKFLKQWLYQENGATYYAQNSKNEIIGMGTRRPNVQENNAQIGPLYADSADIGAAILQRLCKDVVGQNVTINTWEPVEAAKTIIKLFNFKHVFDGVRMHINGDIKEVKPTIICSTSIDVCGF